MKNFCITAHHIINIQKMLNTLMISSIIDEKLSRQFTIEAFSLCSQMTDISKQCFQKMALFSP